MMEHSLLAALFDQKVTVYHPTFGEQFCCRRLVLEGVSYQWSRNSSLGTMGKGRSNKVLMGESLENSGLLNIPCWDREWQEEENYTGQENAVTLSVGDKVYPGLGPRVTTPQQWADLVPANCPGLVVIRQVTPYRAGDRVVLVEGKGG